MSRSVAIIGAGLCGLLCGISLARRGMRVDIYEKRNLEQLKSPRSISSSGRSMSMDLSSRGLLALEKIGIAKELVAKSVPMRNKIFHTNHSALAVIPYGRSRSEFILTIARSDLFNALYRKASKQSQITIHFGNTLNNIDFTNRSASILCTNTNTKFQIKPHVIIGADGINSQVRKQMSSSTCSTFSKRIFHLHYKELSIPHCERSGLELQAMHIWPREELMLVAQPNIDKSFTCALMMKPEGNKNSFSSIDTAEKIRALFKKELADIEPFMPYLESEYQNNPANKLNTVMGSSWCRDNFALIIGDAAHAMTPFFGQGVNCSFEDCTYLNDCLESCGNNWPDALTVFNKHRPPNANAINEMSYDNYPELFPDANIDKLLLEKEVEAYLANHFKEEYRSSHNLVCFDHIPYQSAYQIKTEQKKLLSILCSGISNINELNANKVISLLRTYRTIGAHHEISHRS